METAQEQAGDGSTEIPSKPEEELTLGDVELGMKSGSCLIFKQYQLNMVLKNWVTAKRWAIEEKTVDNKTMENRANHHRAHVLLMTVFDENK